MFGLIKAANESYNDRRFTAVYDNFRALLKRVEALEADQQKESVKEFLYSLRRSNNEQWDRIAALEAKAEKKLAAAEYNAYEAGYRAASGGEPSPEHKAAISKPIKKAQPAPKEEKDLINQYIKKLESLSFSTVGYNDPDKLKIQFAIQNAIDVLKAGIA